MSSSLRNLKGQPDILGGGDFMREIDGLCPCCVSKLWSDGKREVFGEVGVFKEDPGMEIIGDFPTFDDLSMRPDLSLVESEVCPWGNDSFCPYRYRMIPEETTQSKL